MSWFCNHNWIKIQETYSSSLREKGCIEISNVRIIDKEDEKVWHGVTTILWECSLCKELRKEEMLGKGV